MAFPVSNVLDNFNRANENPLTTTNWGASFSPAADPFQVVTNAATTTSGGQGYCAAYWKTSFTGSIEVYLTITTVPANGTSVWLDIITNATINSASPNIYQMQISKLAGTDTIKVFRVDAGVGSLLATYNQEVANGDSVGLSLAGGVLTAFYKSGAGAWTFLGTSNDLTYKGTFNIGFETDGEASAPIFDNFGGGNISGILTSRSGTWGDL